MRHTFLTFAFMGIFFNRLFASDTTADFAFIDNYLARWDRFAQGENQLVSSLKSDKEKFLNELASAVSSLRKPNSEGFCQKQNHPDVYVDCPKIIPLNCTKPELD